MMKLAYKTALAPMAGFTDHAFRQICRECGAEMMYTEMLSAKAIHFRDRKTAELGELFDGEPTGVQIFGSEPLIMAEAAEKLATASYDYCKSKQIPLTIDINMGCPAPKVANNGEGSGLMRTPDTAEAIVREVKRAVTNIPVTVKMRIGWSEDAIIGRDFAVRMEQAGADAITIHGRTREGRFSAPINFEEMRRIKEAVSVPVIGNGEIFTADDAVRMIERTGCDAVMLGRGSLGNPWLFAEIRAKLAGEAFTPPTDRERIETAIRQLDINIADKGEKMGVLQARGQLSWYLKGIRGAAGARGALNTANTRDEAAAILRSVIR
ncbi:MAG: tRNA dihydrouridine synthase DusB [Ruminococcaceae bacterium]|nr:tRNA dihydrouridine synthase DusB [Oscillospiraceae bacterium]